MQTALLREGRPRSGQTRTSNPDPKLVLLGDYIDRGIFSLTASCATAMQMFITRPSTSTCCAATTSTTSSTRAGLRRGEAGRGDQHAQAAPAGQTSSAATCGSSSSCPTCCSSTASCSCTAASRATTLIKERCTDLSTLNDPDMRFQMMWSDPSERRRDPRGAAGAVGALPLRQAAVPGVPAADRLPHAGPRAREGGRGLPRRLRRRRPGSCSRVFSAGGADNATCPPRAATASVTPMAMTIRRSATGETHHHAASTIDYGPATTTRSGTRSSSAPTEIVHRVD